MKTNFSAVAVLSFSIAAWGCGGATTQGNGTNPQGGNDSGAPPPATDAGAPMPVTDAGSPSDASAEADAPPPVDHGMPSSTYPAFTPYMGQLSNNGGLVMTTPIVVAITWNSDASQASFEQFVDNIGASAYWKAVVGEYGVGPVTSGMINHVHLATAAPATMADADFQTMVTTNAGTAWPAASDQTIYAFFLPPGTSLQMQGADACSQGVGGYHDQVTAGAVVTSYAVVPSCNFGIAPTNAEQTTMAMSHELSEAVTDPHPQDAKNGWYGFDPDYFAFDWFQEFSSENGDACELFKSSFYQNTETSFSFWVQRTWSNKSGAAGHSPCVPAPAEPYFNVVPLNLDTVNLDLSQLMGSTMQPTKGLHIQMGKTVTIPLGFYSDGPTSGPWTISYTEGSPLNPPNPTRLTVTFDKTSGVNGEKAYVTITPNIVGPLKGDLIVFHSTLGSSKHVLPVVIGAQ